VRFVLTLTNVIIIFLVRFCSLDVRSSRSSYKIRYRVSVIAWPTVLISFDLSLWKRTWFAVVTYHSPLLLLWLVIDITSKAYTHADVVTIVSCHRKNSHSKTTTTNRCAYCL